ncbi:conserved hypothetical protein [Bradyrhizobium sp. STM 3843]|uniref:YlxR family protein n=1 Tax=Bradyrhizobium sp. STM 3843 TaxID=551947 RepID=UPI000240B038|nr:YlxR family protein [Bradyrhizobium sp. STM 3843]CCE06948.1 conserved hypothetical protein [Bradyrhizobium sp. STM 3843]
MLALADPELDNGPRTEKSATMRTCAVSREVRPTGELIRFVVAPSGEVIPDIKRRLPGRGLWVSATRQAVAEAVRRHHFSRGFKRDVRVSPALSQRPSRVAIAALIHAADGAPDGIRKLDALTRPNAGDPGAGDQGQAPPFPIIGCLTSAELDLALGRSNVIHAALLAGPASRTFLSRSQTLVRYRSADADKTAGTAARTSKI